MADQIAKWFLDICRGMNYHQHENELKELCSAMDISYAQYEKMAKDERSFNIGGTLIFLNKIDKFLNYMRKNKPRWQPYAYQQLDWDDIEAQADSSFRLGDPLLKFFDYQPINLPEKGKYKLWYHELIDALSKYYDDAEFRKMCVDLNINFLNTVGKKPQERAQEAVFAIMQQADGISKMVKYCRQNRPRVQPLWVHSIPWDDIVERASAALKEGNLLHDPILAKRIRQNH